MWRFKPFMQKEQVGLEGRSIDVGNLKIHVRNAIAEGGFSCVYLVRDMVNVAKQYALKHMICNDEESLEFVMREISVMKALRGHPNVVTLCAHSVLDMGRTKEAYLVMEFCERSLVNVLESRGSGYFDERQILLIFRDVCNAVFAMHCQSPPIAHRDLKAENLLLGSDGSWKLCDFGSTSTNHKRFEKPEEMGIEEDNIRKHTTPAYRAPEMWDLFRREVINEKVDIWALGCLLFRICYFKSAFDGESKLQILNGNYRIPELPKYSTSMTDLIREMLQASPDDRPDITQVWFRVNEQLPEGLQKSLPDRPPELHSTEAHEGNSRPVPKSTPMPRRSPPPPPSSSEPSPQQSVGSKAVGGGQLGAFWSMQHAKDSSIGTDNIEPKFDSEPLSAAAAKHDRSRSENQLKNQTHTVRRNSHGSSKDFETSFFRKDAPEQHRATEPSQDEAFNNFVADFDMGKLNSAVSKKTAKEQELEAEVEKLKERLKEANVEKAEIASKFDKLSVICRSQRMEIQELKQAAAARIPSPIKDASKSQIPGGVQSSLTSGKSNDKVEGTVGELHQERENRNSTSSDPKVWQAFAEEPKPEKTLSTGNVIKSVRTRNGQQNKQATTTTTATPAAGFDSWGFGAESFTAAPTGNSQMTRLSPGNGSHFQRGDETKAAENKPSSQPAGWAGF